MASTAFPAGWKQTHIVFCWRRSCRTLSQRYLGTSYCDARVCFRSQDTPGPCCHTLLSWMSQKVCRGKLAKQGCLSFANNWGADAEKRNARPNAPVDQDNKWQTAVHTWQQQLQTKACTTFRRVVVTENTKPSQKQKQTKNTIFQRSWDGGDEKTQKILTKKQCSRGFGIGVLPQRVSKYCFFSLRGPPQRVSKNCGVFFYFSDVLLFFL